MGKDTYLTGRFSTKPITGRGARRKSRSFPVALSLSLGARNRRGNLAPDVLSRSMLCVTAVCVALDLRGLQGAYCAPRTILTSRRGANARGHRSRVRRASPFVHYRPGRRAKNASPLNGPADFRTFRIRGSENREIYARIVRANKTYRWSGFDSPRVIFARNRRCEHCNGTRRKRVYNLINCVRVTFSSPSCVLTCTLLLNAQIGQSYYFIKKRLKKFHRKFVTVQSRHINPVAASYIFVLLECVGLNMMHASE